MTTFDVSNKDLVALFNKYDIEYVKFREDDLIVQWGRKEDSTYAYFIVGINDGSLICHALYQLVDNITDRNELLHTLNFSSDFCMLNMRQLEEDNTLTFASLFPVEFGVSEVTVAVFMGMFSASLLEMEGKLEDLRISFNSIAEKRYDELFSES